MNFEETYLNDNILDALYDMHFEEMTPVQEKCIPEILDGRDMIGVADGYRKNRSLSVADT